MPMRAIMVGPFFSATRIRHSIAACHSPRFCSAWGSFMMSPADGPSLAAGGSPAEYRAGIERAINHGFLLKRAVRIRQSYSAVCLGSSPRHSTHRAVSLTILAAIKLTPSRCGSRRSIAADVKKLGGQRAAILRVAVRRRCGVFEHACKLACEGIVAKRKDLPYQSGRSKRWLKAELLPSISPGKASIGASLNSLFKVFASEEDTIDVLSVIAEIIKDLLIFVVVMFGLLIALIVIVSKMPDDNPLKGVLTALSYRIGATAAAGLLAIPIEPIPGLDVLYDIGVPVALIIYWISFLKNAGRTTIDPSLRQAQQASSR
jgi:hypothetical protein